MINLSLPSGDSLARIPHKLEVLRQHCVTVGRDPAQITVTYKATMAVAERENRPGRHGTGGARPSGCASLLPRRGRSSASPPKSPG